MNRGLRLRLVALFALGAVLLSSAGAGVRFAAAKSVSELQSEYAQLEQRRAEVNKELEAAADTADAQRQKRARIEEKIEITERQVALLNSKIYQLNQDIQDKQTQLEARRAEVKATYALYKQRVRAAYMSADPTMLGVLLGAESLSDLLMRMELVRRVSLHDAQIVDSLKRSIEQLKAAESALHADEADLSASKEKLAERQSDLDVAYRSASAKTRTYEQEYEYYKQNKEALEKQMAAADADIKAALAEAKRLREQAEKERQLAEKKKQQKKKPSDAKDDETDAEQTDSTPTASETPEDGAASFNGMFLWPVPGFYVDSSTYGWRTWPDGSREFHKGLDIAGANIYGARIVAGESGYVLRAYDNGNGYGIHVLIDHGDYKGKNLATLYGHMSRVAVDVGDYVKRGQTIGYVGSTGWATGPHLHFEVRRDGEATDPMPYLK